MCLIHQTFYTMAQLEMESSFHNHQPAEMLAAAFASPTFSQVHRESSTSPRNPVEIQHTNHKSQPNDDQEQIHDDPLNAAAAMWTGATGNSQPSPADDVNMENTDASRLDSFPFSFHVSTSGSFLDHEYPHLLGTPPFLVDEGRCPDAMPVDQAHRNISAGATLTAETEQVAPEAVQSTLLEQEHAIHPMEVQSRTPGTRRRSTRSSHSSSTTETKQKRLKRGGLYRQPSQAELASCASARSMSALAVWYQRYNELVDYKKSNGDCNVPQTYKPNRALGTW